MGVCRLSGVPMVEKEDMQPMSLASLRVQGTLMSIGESAGIMGALAAKRDCSVPEIPEADILYELRKRKLVL